MVLWLGRRLQVAQEHAPRLSPSGDSAVGSERHQGGTRWGRAASRCESVSRHGEDKTSGGWPVVEKGSKTTSSLQEAHQDGDIGPLRFWLKCLRHLRQSSAVSCQLECFQRSSVCVLGTSWENSWGGTMSMTGQKKTPTVENMCGNIQTRLCKKWASSVGWSLDVDWHAGVRCRAL